MESKFTSYDNHGNEISHEYGNVFEVEQLKNTQRLKIGASSSQAQLMLDLAGTLNPPYFILYVLLNTRRGNELGRYQSPLIESITELQNFLQHYSKYFETDGRHHVWIASPEGKYTLIYDQHNVIYAYGPLETFRQTLEEKGFTENSFNFPSPHAHHFNKTNDNFEDEIVKEWDWSISELQENDEYD